MSVSTPIQWADCTCNPIMGCTGCELWDVNRQSCYAGAQHEHFGEVRRGFSPDFSEITFWPGRVATAAAWPDLAGRRRAGKPWLDGLPRVIFVSDMGDALCSNVPFEYLRREIIETVAGRRGHRHRWLWLTRRPERMAEFSDWLAAQGIRWPSNLWTGTTVTTAGTTSRIDELLNVGTDATIHFLSVEPQLEPLDLSLWLPRLDWIIQGGESGNQPRKFELRWAQMMYKDCQEAGTPYFLKQLGGYVFRGEDRVRLKDHHGGDWTEWPDDVPRARQVPQKVDCRSRTHSTQMLSCREAGGCPIR